MAIETPTRPQSRRRQFALENERAAEAPPLESVKPRSPRAVIINRFLALYLLLLVAFDLALQRWSDFVLDLLISIPLAVLFMVAARNLGKGESPSRNWLNISGLTCALFGVLSATSFPSALEAPVDVACAFWSSTIAVAMTYAAWHQLRLSKIWQ